MYLAPMTTVFARNTNFSSSVEMPPGSVPKGPVSRARERMAPWEARSLAVARPIPEAAPVRTITLPESEFE